MRGKRNNKGVKNKSVTIPNEPLISKTSQCKSEPEADLNIRHGGCVSVTVAPQRRRFQHHTALQVKTPQSLSGVSKRKKRSELILKMSTQI